MFGLFKQKPQPATEPILVQLTHKDGITLHQAYEGCWVSGSIGGGKSSGPGDALARGFLRHGAGFCIMVAKPGEFAYWKRLCEEEGRAADLVRFAPDSGVKCDLLNFELSQPQGTVAGAAALLNMLVDMTSRQSEGGGDESYWRNSCDKAFRRAIHAVWTGQGKCALTDLYKFIVSAPTSSAQVKDQTWIKESFCAQCLLTIIARPPIDYDASLTIDYWLSEWPNLSDKTRSIIFSMTTNVLDNFLFGEVARMISGGETNFTPDDIAKGKVCVLDMPALQWATPGIFFQVLFKTLVQRAILRRDVKLSPLPVTIWQDECQIFITDYDVQVQAVARASKLSQVFLTQSLPVLFQALGGGQKAEQQAKALIGNLQTKFLCQQSDHDTNQFFSDLLGKSKHLFGSSSVNTGTADPVGDFLGTDQQGSFSTSEQWHPDVPPEAFTRLRKGGAEFDYLVDAYVFQGGRRFSNGKTWVKAEFEQRRS